MAIDWILTNAKSPPFERIANPLPESCWSWLQPMTAVASLSELEGDAGGGKMTSKLTLPLEWYRCGPVTVLQQRAPCVPVRNDLIDFMEKIIYMEIALCSGSMEMVSGGVKTVGFDHGEI